MEGVAAVSGKKRMARIRWPKPFPGGIRTAHFHHRGDVYMVDQRVWNRFSKQVVNDMRKRLDAAKVLAFDELVEMSEGVGRVR
jgi:hypothetical protein